jgi:FAD synthase
MGDLYGKPLRIYFKKWLRENLKFESVEALKNQLTEDVRRVTEND